MADTVEQLSVTSDNFSKLINILVVPIMNKKKIKEVCICVNTTEYSKYGVKTFLSQNVKLDNLIDVEHKSRTIRHNDQDYCNTVTIPTKTTLVRSSSTVDGRKYVIDIRIADLFPVYVCIRKHCGTTLSIVYGLSVNNGNYYINYVEEVYNLHRKYFDSNYYILHFYQSKCRMIQIDNDTATTPIVTNANDIDNEDDNCTSNDDTDDVEHTATPIVTVTEHESDNSSSDDDGSTSDYYSSDSPSYTSSSSGSEDEESDKSIDIIDEDTDY